MHLDLLANPDLPIGELLVVVLAEQAAEQDPGLARPHPLRLDEGDRERADAKLPSNRDFCSCGPRAVIRRCRSRR